jgi:phosphate transport system permease protein
MNRYLRRKCINAVALGCALVATLIALGFLTAILVTLVRHGAAGISLHLFTQDTPAPGNVGGLRNALYGSFIMTLLAILIGAPIGIFAGTYLAEYGRGTRTASTVRFVNDILLSAPSIIIGLFVYEIIVVHMKHFSALAGALALAIIAIPVIVRTTEDMLMLVPAGVRDASVALGAQRWRTTFNILYPAAKSGLLTGVLLAVARISGETAPLLFTALNNQFWSRDLNAPMANLPVTIYQFAQSPYDDWQQLAWSGALVVTVVILALNILARATIRGSAAGGR